MAERSIAVHSAEAGVIMENVIAKGDLAALTPAERSQYYIKVCESMGLNPLTQPFQYIELDKKLTLYATRTATDQLRSNRGISVRIVSRERAGDVYLVTVEAHDAAGRTDTSIGAVALVKEDGEWKTASSGKRYFAGNGILKPLGPDDLANAYMRAETKAKRRVTLSISGLGWLDESEIETIPNARIGEPPVPIKTTAQLSQPSDAAQLPPGDATAKKADPLRDAKATLWREAQLKGLTVELLGDYAQETLGAQLEDMTTAAVVQLTQKLKREEAAMLLDRLTNRPAAEVIDAPDMFPDVEFAPDDKPDPWTR